MIIAPIIFKSDDPYCVDIHKNLWQKLMIIFHDELQNKDLTS